MSKFKELEHISKEQIRNFIQYEKRKRGWTYKDLLARFELEGYEITLNTINSWALGSSLPKVTYIIVLADIMGVDVTEIINYKPDK